MISRPIHRPSRSCCKMFLTHANDALPSVSGATPTPKSSPTKSTPRRWKLQEPSRGHWRQPSPSLRKISGRRPPWALFVFETQAGPDRKHTILNCAHCFGIPSHFRDCGSPSRSRVRERDRNWSSQVTGVCLTPSGRPSILSMEELSAFSLKFYLMVTGTLHFHQEGSEASKETVTTV